MTYKCGVLGFLALAAIATMSIPVMSAPTFAAEQFTYEQAWATCKKFMDDQRTPGTLTSNERWFRGSACMKKFGHNI